MNEKQIELVKWGRKYEGLSGCLKFLFPFLGLGMIFSPIILTLINPNIWNQLKESNFSNALAPLLFLCLIFSILPFTTVGIILWKRKMKQYKLLTTNEDKYREIEERSWYGNDKKWDTAIRYGGSFSILIAFLTIPFLFVHNAPKYYSYPFLSCCLLLAFAIIYTTMLSIFSQLRNGKLYVAKFVKIIFVVLVILVSASILVFLFNYGK